MDVVNPIIKRWQQDAAADPDAFWARAAARVHWFKPWETTFAWTPPTFRWFAGGQTNISYNALDLHVNRGHGGHAALIALDERGCQATFTYAQLLAGVKRIAVALRGAGVQRGDRVGVYMPTIPEAIMAMLACTRIGAIHLVVFAGFGSGALGERLQLSGAKLLLTADITPRRGKDVPLLGIVKEAIDQPGSPVERVVVLRRAVGGPGLDDPRAIDWNDFLAGGVGQSDAHESMEANEPAFVLATSGTTAKPKLAVHSHGAYQVGIHSTSAWLMALRETDIWWSTSDIGWVVGHSYIVYAPLLAGCTTIAYEGALDYPDAGVFYRVLAEQRVTGVFTAPTAVRMLMAHGTAAIGGSDLSAVERVFCAGEVLNVPAWEWFQREVFQDRVPVIDHMWQTETGGPVFGNPYGISLLPIKPGAAGIALPGFFAEVRTMEGEPCAPNEKGIVVITRPFPGLTGTIWGDPERYANDYWGRIPGAYFTGDAASVDEDGYYTFSGRADEIIKIAGHKLGTIEIETALLRHPAVAEAGVTGRPDDLRGEVISAFVVLRQGHERSDALKGDLLATVRRELGPVAVISEINFVRALPKTRSGKIMRRVFKAVVLDRDPGDISTIEDAGSVEEARAAWRAFQEDLRLSLTPGPSPVAAGEGR